jgi:acetyl-CoA/propionyl-CoA carboxylase biotin carboxyl carrier protein
MGSKTTARERMAAAGVPVVPGTTEPVTSADEVLRLGDELGWPLAIKGGGGRRRQGPEGRAGPGRGGARLRVGPAEGQAYFADPSVYVERYLEGPRVTSRCRCSPTATGT